MFILQQEDRVEKTIKLSIRNTGISEIPCHNDIQSIKFGKMLKTKVGT